MRNILLIISLFFTFNIFCQNALQFSQVIDNDTFIVYQKDKVKLSYKGYLQQEETKKGKILVINDSIIIIGKSLFGNNYNQKIILISDIQGVKKFTKFYQISKFTVNVAGLAGSILLPEVLGVTGAVGIYSTALGAGFIGFGLTSIIFNEKIRVSKKTGWDLKILYPKL
jgi:hypothetical protein